MAHRRKGSPVTDEMLRWAEGVVRFEITVRGQELKDAMFELGITPRALAAVKYGDEFGRIMAARLWLRYFAMVEVGDNVTGKNDIEKLPKGMIRLLYSGWCKGDDPRDMVSMATFYRHRKQITRILVVSMVGDGSFGGIDEAWIAPLQPGRIVQRNAKPHHSLVATERSEGAVPSPTSATRPEFQPISLDFDGMRHVSY